MQRVAEVTEGMTEQEAMTAANNWKYFRELERMPDPVQHQRPAPVVDEEAADLQACEQLWSAVLAALLSDAARYWQGLRPRFQTVEQYELEAAFDDVMRCGPMLRHVCAFTERNPADVQAAFIRWCESYPVR